MSFARIEFGLDEMQPAVLKVLGMLSEDFQRKVAEINRLKLEQGLTCTGFIVYSYRILFDEYPEIDPKSSVVIDETALHLQKEIVNYNLWCFLIWMTGGDLNEVRNMNLEDTSVSIDQRKSVFDLRKKCFAMFLYLINGK